MQPSTITNVVMPVALGIIMLGLGLSLTLDDFKRVLNYPRAVVIGLFCQMILLPAVAVGVAHLFELPAALAVGLMLLAAAPGGATANLFSHLAKGDVALNITLTAVNSLLALLTLPLIVNWSLVHFMGEGQVIPMVFDKVLQVFVIVLGPVAIGMAVRRSAPATADRLDKPVRILSALFLVLVIAAAVAAQRENMAKYFQQVGLAALTFNLVSMAVGYVIPRLFGVLTRQAISIGMEIGIHNGTLAIYIASQILKQPDMAISPAIYSLIMFFTAAAFGTYMARRGGSEEEQAPASAP
jgi:BASS family bile acid:Na+ symporter